MALYDITYKKHQVPTDKAKLIFVTMAQYWNIFLTTNISKSNT